MLVDVKVPELSESVAEATLVTWHKKAGEKVERSENLIDIETDKVVMELPAPNAGVLKVIHKQDGATVVSGEVIAVIDTEASASESEEGEEDIKPITDVHLKGPSTSADKEIAAKNESHAGSTLMPAARRLIDENNMKSSEVANIKGSGLGGRILKEDVQAALTSKTGNIVENTPQSAPQPEEKSQSSAQQPVQSLNQSSTSRKDRRVPMSRLRQTIAQRLVESQSTAAILTTFNEVNMQAVIDLRTRYKVPFEKEHGVKLGFMSFFVKAVVAALKKYPIINASVEGTDIVYHDYYDIGIAVSSPRGLVVPVIRNADQLTLAGIEKQISDFANRAQEGKLTLEELSGGTFSITNGGVFGSMLSTPIINPPQSAILGIHATKDRPVVENGQIVIRPMNYLALSYDHRIIDGRDAVLSLVAMKEALEYPVSPLLEI
ncbi:MAG TPA: 2-oxoglutarate dehydrogenase complex dihydrolipoyllysine-residue succinyltransferase [Nitrosomonas sp.]|nr:2-oxoglutarate dehydrogenase complex dihydrolipoyllysine-residue succinyltransferase [Nitrosomonas sp.]HQX14127.1 2-oxoglutarate dehydrogenase complex dihydrolipoyllysine-residue succinyltransferase [Nitrosomonas sp.]HRB20855.1 2-oxoglutarate dehydrogenase complex dihydrolipoyllysine-residue succinyltransferase [Nitrosomonas sp.]HRB31674.1 2-oxoglutarate dehydrogenase complex dihydrolipoyllysine-residue succinyltransferase [Nitrosomonas sp.]HRB44486.1 2-oxoglutarate dehydrogenase complex dih